MVGLNRAETDGRKRTKSRSTVHSVQLLRAVAALLVALYHGQLAFSNRGSEPAFVAETYLFGFGQVGVHVFFVISGFIMVYSSRFDPRFAARDFFRRRLLRIYPIYWLCAIAYLLVHALIGKPYELQTAKLVGALLLFPGRASAIIGPAWTLSFEMYFYLCFGIAMIAGLSRGLLLLVTAFAGSVALGFFFQVHTLVTDSLLLEFIAGAAIGWLLVTGNLPRRGGTVMIGSSVIVFGCGILWGYDRLPGAIMWGVPSALIVAGVVSREATKGVPFWLRRVGMLGDSSYALYLIHILFITLALEIAKRTPGSERWEPAVVALIVAAIAQLGAELLHRRIERPLLRALNPQRALVPERNPGSTG